MKTHKRIGTLCLLAIALMVLAGCAQVPPTSAPTVAPTIAAAVAPTQAVTVAPADAPTVGPTKVPTVSIDPKLAASWEYMQREMPGVPYSLLAGACAEGSLMIYSGTYQDAEEAEIAAFKKRFPCITKVETFYAVTAERRQRWLTEMNAKLRIADIVHETDPGTFNEQAAKGLLMEYGISNEKEYPDALKLSRFWYPLRTAMVAIAWNTTQVSEKEAALLSSWKGIIDPVFKNRLEVVDPANGGVSYLPVYMWYTVYGEEFIKKLAENKPRVVSATNPASAALASGDIAVYINASESGLTPLIDQGAPIRYSLPEPGVGPASGQAISALAPHPNAAKLFHEYTFALEGYSTWQKLGGAPSRIGYRDERDIAKQPWYKYPSTFYAYDPKVATDTSTKINTIFNQLMAAAR